MALRKRWEWVLVACLTASAPAWAGNGNGFSQFVLDNGLRVVLQEKRDQPLSGITLAVELGTAQDSEPAGRAHLLEHMILFGAVEPQSGPERLAGLRARGLSVNAHTDADLMTFECSGPAGETGWALEQIRRQVFMARLTAEQLESEKRVLMSEIAQLHDDPESAGRLMALRLLFGDHPYGRPVEGDEASIASATLDGMELLRRRLLRPDRCALAVVGDFSAADMEAQVRRIWDTAERPASDPEAPPPAIPKLSRNAEADLPMDVQECHLFIAWLGPGFNESDRVPVNLLSHILGRGLNPLLVSALRSPRDLVERVDMRYFAFRQGGALLLHLALPARNLRSAKTTLSDFLRNLRNLHLSGRDVLPAYASYVPDYLESARNQSAIENEAFRESAPNLALAAARFLLLNDRPADRIIREEIEKLTSSDLRRAGVKYLSGKKWAAVAVVPVNR